jgi:restriction system protein
MDIVAMLPWWVGVMLALVSYVLLHSVASQQVVATAQPGQVGAMVTQTCS